MTSGVRHGPSRSIRLVMVISPTLSVFMPASLRSVIILAARARRAKAWRFGISMEQALRKASKRRLGRTTYPGRPPGDRRGDHGRAHRRRGWKQRDLPPIYRQFLGHRLFQRPHRRSDRRLRVLPIDGCCARCAGTLLAVAECAGDSVTIYDISNPRRPGNRVGDAHLQGYRRYLIYGGYVLVGQASADSGAQVALIDINNLGEFRKPTGRLSPRSRTSRSSAHMRSSAGLAGIPTPFRSPRPAIFTSWPRPCQ